MRIILRTLIVTCLIFAGHGSYATPQEDAALIAHRTVIVEIGETAIAERLRELQVQHYTELLNARRVSVVDPSRFRDMLPLPDPSSNIAQISESLAERYMHILSETELAATADFLRVHEHATINQKVQEMRRVSMREMMNENDPSWYDELIRARDIQSLSISARRWPKLNKPDANFPLADPVVIEILQTKGIVRATNRVVISDLVQELRQSIESDDEPQQPRSGGIQFSTPPARD